ncbi:MULTISPECIES: PDR/VanB family oxidoreductase [unclassified Saccharopolyspora]|uniref:PDR/VanB family oxidoreductase n=1 Tax=unclassified Saccharopolyspora TaxID=2646250 RepID=UPI001CD6AC2A|nr:MULTISPECIES: PDR/VanB family oxidoreductase [unclassified Saccharopolyspora]MCA1185055.1 PDR/VanB family oxidoreductase [Saccharopolyspora sp. 6T]MCA1190770.1 PDR/VanB family oxidoreductase [Saccharopolyspora sp. 6V]MCA1226267.1 PDR/VanB family oxidoreductase [Saccharopolyspora sp. 6M]MCA1278234.1 PDR/VanB family oxidoreductase [Saccharopolyspora sp. 7B]
MTATSAPLELTLRSRSEVADGVLLLEFTATGGGELPGWEPGAHLDLRLPSGAVRQYSLCGDPGDRRAYTVCVLREATGRGGSVELHDRLRVGDEITGSAPRNHFPLHDAPEHVLLAGGIGITPIKAMLDELHRRGAPWRLVYGGRTRAAMAFAAELAAAHPGRVSIVPEDERGRPDVERIVAELPATARLYCCGPAAMLDAVAAACERTAISDRLHVERFAAAGDAPDPTGDSAFEVELRETGTTVTVAADQSLLSAVQQVRPDIPSSCQEGYCGTCETRVLEGEPDHRGTLLSPAEHDEEGTMLICVGRARSPKLVLEL